jgi:hypothetical protein
LLAYVPIDWSNLEQAACRMVAEMRACAAEGKESINFSLDCFKQKVEKKWLGNFSAMIRSCKSYSQIIQKYKSILGCLNKLKENKVPCVKIDVDLVNSIIEDINIKLRALEKIEEESLEQR